MINDADVTPRPSKRTLHLGLVNSVELTPEAQAILTKQINRKIVWEYKVSRIILQFFACFPLLISVGFGYAFFVVGIHSLSVAALAATFVGVPIIGTGFLLRLARKY